jgi:hypothetical protein
LIENEAKQLCLIYKCGWSHHDGHLVHIHNGTKVNKNSKQIVWFVYMLIKLGKMKTLMFTMYA